MEVANVREEPDTSAQVACQLKSGDSVHSLKKDGAWHRVYVADTGKFGWIHQSTLASPTSTDSSGHVELFGTPLKTATRQVMRQTLAKTNVIIIREDNDYWVDTYNSASELNGTNQLSTGYTNAGDLAFAQYRFPSRMDKHQVTQIAEMVATKYDNWDTVDGNPGLGDVEYQWNVDGMIIRVFRGWPNTTTFLKYEIPGNLRSMQAEIEASKKRTTEREAQGQTKAF
ncbi:MULTISPECIES: SH3 domain-containing protein [unclassified Marinobacter]|uniref:SH3 domain-containing protein n=1 Tax=unclassified Marinobacter TaxID=83889 RepID=UPI00200CD3F9|nr:MULTISPECIES: SH3 domain-containing protein [unclassified Marinobacter]UQG56585.1 SH3 domain-containing protein [Marinobacter sp. M4C]UQG65389.1 SH3 domain-containing protein [Marinobacter sp. M2C]UQG69668.1 SH3 domain-containing protein [Marinobacter sp. M1C]